MGIWKNHLFNNNVNLHTRKLGVGHYGINKGERPEHQP